MKLTVKLLIVCSSAFVLSGCGQTALIYEGCTTPDVTRVKLDTRPTDNILDTTKQVARNYLALKKENALLWEANEVCK